jgi:hypothetical protein
VLALRNIAIGFVAQGISIIFITQNLAFASEDETCKFLTTLQCVIKDEGDLKLDCRASIPALRKAPLKVRKCEK